MAGPYDYSVGDMYLPPAPQRAPGERSFMDRFLFGTGQRPDFGVDEGMRAREENRDIAGMAPEFVSPETKRSLGIMPLTEKTPPTNLNPPRMPVTEKTPPTNLTPPPRMPATEKTPPSRLPSRAEQETAAAPAWYETDNFYKALTNLGLGLLARNKPGYGGLQGFAQALGEAGLDTTSYLEQLNAAERAAANDERTAARADRALDIQEQANQLANARGLQQLTVDRQKLMLEIAKAESAQAKAALEQQLKVIEMAIDMYTAQAEAGAITGQMPNSLDPFMRDIHTQLRTPGTRQPVISATDLGFESTQR